MAVQWPIDGVPGKAWKVTSPFGWRVHPKTKEKKHHNGVDIWQGKEPTYLEAWVDGKVISVTENTDPNSAGNKVIVQSVVMGKKITWTYFHMVHKSIKVKKGQKITAGTVIGKMGATGFATGKHLHWEIWAGHLVSQPNINTGGKGFYDPMAFAKAAIEFEKTHANAPLATPETAPVTPMPAHSVEAEPKPVTSPVAPVVRPTLKLGMKNGHVKVLQQKLGLPVDGEFGPKTKTAVIAFQKKNVLTPDGVVGSSTWAKLG